MRALDEVAETHDKGRRHNGDFLKSHEFAMFIIALEYCGIRDLPTLLSIILHDMHEDYKDIWPIERIAQEFGLEVSVIVDAVTKPEKWRYRTEKAYDQAIFKKVRAGGPKAMDVKCVDRLHNMLTLVGTVSKRTRKVIQTIRFVMPISAERGMLLYELMEATKEQMRRLKMTTKHIAAT